MKCAKLLLLSLSCLIAFACAEEKKDETEQPSTDPTLVFSTGQSASLAISTTGMNSPAHVWTDGTKIAVSIGNHHRVLIWNTWPTTNGQAADLVLGQADFASDATGTTGSTMSGPNGLLYNNSQLYVADVDNNRVLVFKKQ